MNDNYSRLICNLVSEIADDIHMHHGYGHMKKFYENSLQQRLEKLGINVKPQYPIKVRGDDGKIKGEFFADLFVDDFLIVELKTNEIKNPEHEALLKGYLTSTKDSHGLLINFGSNQLGIKAFED